jgi:hypothetical protein
MPGVTAIVPAGTPLACFSNVKPRRALALLLIAITSADCAGQYLEVAQQGIVRRVP